MCADCTAELVRHKNQNHGVCRSICGTDLISEFLIHAALGHPAVMDNSVHKVEITFGVLYAILLCVYVSLKSVDSLQLKEHDILYRCGYYHKMYIVFVLYFSRVCLFLICNS